MESPADITIDFVPGALPPAAETGPPAGTGAWLVFEGVVRPEENGAGIDGLEYEAYRPMADKQLARIAGEAAKRFGLLAVAVEHSIGFVPAGRRSFRLGIASRHRKEGLSAADFFIGKMKRDVPIWKKAVAPGARD